MKTLLPALLIAALSTCAFAADAPAGAKAPAAAKRRVVTTTRITTGARRLLSESGCVLEDGYLRKRGSDDKSTDLTSGGGALFVTLNPKKGDALAVGAYDRGKRYVTLEAGCDDGKAWVAPLELAPEAAAKIFPGTLK